MPGFNKETGKLSESPSEKPIVFSVGKDRREILPSRLASFFASLSQYASHYSRPAILARFTEHPFEDSFSREPGNQQSDAFFLNAVHRATADAIGLAIASTTEPGTDIYLGDSSADAGKVGLTVTSPAVFAGFLSALTSREITSLGIIEHAADLDRAMSEQVLDLYNQSFPQGLPRPVAAAYADILREYKRLKLTNQFSRLENTLSHAQAGDLREFVAIQRAGLFTKPGEYYGPGNWTVDIGENGLRENWTNALQLARAAKLNPHARKLYQQLRSHLLICARYSLEKTAGFSHYSGTQKAVFIQIIQDAIRSLEEM